MSTTKEVAVIDLFCGVGGLSLGLKASGLNVVAGIDLDPACQFPFQRNIKTKFLLKDVAIVSAEELGALYEGAKVRVLAACAPCQPFSGYSATRRGIDERWKLLLEVLRLAKIGNVDIVTVENVARLAKLDLWTKFVAALTEFGFHVTWDILDASYFGVPQKRRRLVLLASRLGKIRLPRPLRNKQTTVRSAIGKLSKISSGEADKKDRLHAARTLTIPNLKRIRASRPAGSWKEWPKNLRTECHKRKSGKTYPSVYGRMSWDKPAPTVTTQFYGFGNGRFGHPEQDRAISLREGAILQSFPASFQFCRDLDRVNFNAIGRLIGNAVPPKLAKAIGKEILAHAATIAGCGSLNPSSSK